MIVKSPLFETELEYIGTGSLVVCFTLDDFKGHSACVCLVSYSQILHIWKALVCLAGSWDEVTVPEKQSCFCILMTVWSGTASRKHKAANQNARFVRAEWERQGFFFFFVSVVNMCADNKIYSVKKKKKKALVFSTYRQLKHYSSIRIIYKY